jgi:hypothetical protein
MQLVGTSLSCLSVASNRPPRRPPAGHVIAFSIIEAPLFHPVQKLTNF